jgi:drug/metabolite transporter (DMT)-like permease
MLMLCLSWGLNQVAVKIAIAEIPPFAQAAVRSFGALIIVAAWARWRGVPLLSRDGTLAAGLVAGALFALEFILMYGGLVFTTASRSALFLYTAPFFIALGARAIGERLVPLQWVGLVLSFAGVAVALGVPGPEADLWMLVGDVMLIGAGAAWGTTTLVIRATRLATAPAEKTLAYQLAVSGPILALCSLVVGERLAGTPSVTSLSWLAYQTIWVVGITYLIWFGMIRTYATSRLSAFTFLTPLFGVTAGHVMLGDPITPAFALAAALVIAGLVLVNRPG